MGTRPDQEGHMTDTAASNRIPFVDYLVLDDGDVFYISTCGQPTP